MTVYTLSVKSMNLLRSCFAPTVHNYSTCQSYEVQKNPVIPAPRIRGGKLRRESRKPLYFIPIITAIFYDPNLQRLGFFVKIFKKCYKNQHRSLMGEFCINEF